MRATYSPEDNKLRLYPPEGERLPPGDYEAIRAAGFRWAPRQRLFVAPMWTPEREDALLRVAGELGDEDTSLAERAGERSERFQVYGKKRAAEAISARAAVNELTGGIPVGQPLAVGRQNERSAQRLAKKIEHEMQRAVSLWETSEYRAIAPKH